MSEFKKKQSEDFDTDFNKKVGSVYEVQDQAPEEASQADRNS